MDTNEKIQILRAACQSAERTLKDAADALKTSGRPVGAASCEKYRQQCLEAIELTGTQEPEAASEAVLIQAQSGEPEIPEMPATPGTKSWNRGPKRRNVPPEQQP